MQIKETLVIPQDLENAVELEEEYIRDILSAGFSYTTRIYTGLDGAQAKVLFVHEKV